MLPIRYYIIRLALAAVIGAVLWGITFPVRAHQRKKAEIQPGAFREAALLLVFLYLSMVFMLTLTPHPNRGWISHILWDEVNLVPIVETVRTLGTYARQGMWFALVANLAGNIIMFMPTGFFAGLLTKKPSWRRALAVSLALSLFIEVGQLFASRGTDVDDLILNTIGGLLGYGVYLLLEKACPSLVQKCRKSAV